MTNSKGFPGDWLCISFAFFLKVHEIIMERKVIFEMVERSRLLRECSPRERIRNVTKISNVSRKTLTWCYCAHLTLSIESNLLNVLSGAFQFTWRTVIRSWREFKKYIQMID